MTKGERLVGSVALCALYLRGARVTSVCQRRRWPLVVDAVRAGCPDLLSLPECLRDRGLFDEAAFLNNNLALTASLELCESGQVLTALDAAYPRGWARALGSGAPPCAWVRGALPSAPVVGVVGSRAIGAADRTFAVGVARLLASKGRALVSGGAAGADSVAADAALAQDAPCIEVLPFGIQSAPPREGVCQISVCEPDAGFTTGQAMERNALIYAFGRRAVVVRAHLRTGGTWHGASDALRRRLGDVYVWTRRGDAACKALCAIGGIAVTRVNDLAPLLERRVVQAQPDLFGTSHVRAPFAGYI